MHPQNFIPFIFTGTIALILGSFVLVLGSFIFKIVKKGGFKTAVFGSPIERTVGEVAATSPSRMKSIVVRVHVLGGHSPDKAVGLEFVDSYQMMPVSLSKVESRKLIMLLESATNGT